MHLILASWAISVQRLFNIESIQKMLFCENRPKWCLNKNFLFFAKSSMNVEGLAKLFVFIPRNLPVCSSFIDHFFLNPSPLHSSHDLQDSPLSQHRTNFTKNYTLLYRITTMSITAWRTDSIWPLDQIFQNFHGYTGQVWLFSFS